jgi:uncharacterized membrane protein
MMGGWGAWGGLSVLGVILGGVLWIALLALVVVAAIWLIRRSIRSPATVRSAAGGETPLEVAQRRLAAGELTVSEFDEIQQRLKNAPTA